MATFAAADVARIVLVLEQSAIAQASLAADQAVTIEVKTYAARVLRERSEAAARLAAILERTNARNEDPTAALLEREAKRTKDALADLQKGTFDLPFMTAEIASNAKMLGLLDVSLLPSAVHATVTSEADSAAGELENELRTLRAALGEHAVHALRVQGVLRAADRPEDHVSVADEASGDAPAAPAP